MSGARQMKVQTTTTARFTNVVSHAGKPKIYLPLFDPKQDHVFMRAVREHRVLSIRQEPTSNRQDFGVVGFEQKPHTTYLIFPKPLTAFTDARIVGIKYSKLDESLSVVGAAPRSAKMPKARISKKAQPAPKAIQAPKPPKPEPQPKDFRVRVQVTTVAERDVTVKAMTKAEAKKKAKAEQSGEGKVRIVSVSEA